ncbi:hypothetical protein GCM10027080_24150 [Pedococcus soli]
MRQAGLSHGLMATIGVLQELADGCDAGVSAMGADGCGELFGRRETATEGGVGSDERLERERTMTGPRRNEADLHHGLSHGNGEVATRTQDGVATEGGMEKGRWPMPGVVIAHAAQVGRAEVGLPEGYVVQHQRGLVARNRPSVERADQGEREEAVSPALGVEVVVPLLRGTVSVRRMHGIPAADEARDGAESSQSAEVRWTDADLCRLGSRDDAVLGQVVEFHRERVSQMTRSSRRACGQRGTSASPGPTQHRLLPKG